MLFTTRSPIHSRSVGIIPGQPSCSISVWLGLSDATCDHHGAAAPYAVQNVVWTFVKKICMLAGLTIIVVVLSQHRQTLEYPHAHRVDVENQSGLTQAGCGRFHRLIVETVSGETTTCDGDRFSILPAENAAFALDTNGTASAA